MRYLGLIVAILLALAGCGDGGGGSTVACKEGVRTTLETLLMAAIEDNLEKAEPHLDLAGYLGHMESKDVSRLSYMSPEEIKEQMKLAFAQLKTVPKESKIKDQESVRAALAGAMIDVRPVTRGASVKLQGLDAREPGKTVSFDAELTQTPGGVWKLIYLEMVF